MLLVEIGLAGWAFRKGWRWRVLLPIGIAFAAAFLIGMGAAAGGGSANAAKPLLALMDIGLIVVLAIMSGRAPVARETSRSAIHAPEVPPDPESVHVFGQNAV